MNLSQIYKGSLFCMRLTLGACFNGNHNFICVSMDNFNFNSTRSKLQYPGYLYCKVHLNSSSLSNKKKPSHEVVYKVYDYNIEIHATKHKKLIFFFSYTELIAYLIASKPLQIPENRPVLHIHVHILI